MGVTTEARSMSGPVFRTETPSVDVTRGPTINHPGDPYRKYVPGLTCYFVDDVEVSEAEFIAAAEAEQARLDADPTREAAVDAPVARLLTIAGSVRAGGLSPEADALEELAPILRKLLTIAVDELEAIEP